MIVRIQYVVSLCSVVGYIATTNGLYLNFAVPKSKALESLQGDPENYTPSNFDKWIRKGHHKKLVILDRKNKRVDDFVKKLMSVIEMNEGDRLLKEDIRKMNCRHVSFGSIYNAKAKRKRCKKQHAVYKRKQPWINFVIPIPVKKVFADSTREGFADDYLLDFDRRDIDFDYFNTVHRAHTDNKNKESNKESNKIKQKNTQTVVANNRKTLRRDHTRFKIVPYQHSAEDSKGKRTKHKNKPSDTSNTESIDDSGTDDESEHKSKQSDANSDDEINDASKSKHYKIKKMKDQWNDIMNMPDTVADSSEESSPPKREKRNKKSYKSDSSDNDDSNSDASAQEENKPHDKNYNNDSDKEKYVYMQGHRIYNSKDNEDSRRMRNKHYFLPKRSFWSEDTIKHLGSYWNSHEIAGVHVN